MQGLLADQNIQGHVRYLSRLLGRLKLLAMLDELHLTLATFGDCGLAQDLDDRSLWSYCQEQGWVLFTDNRTGGGADSLEATLRDLWRTGSLPVLTLSSKQKFEQEPEYAAQVAEDVAEVLFGIHSGEYRNQPRIYVPL